MLSPPAHGKNVSLSEVEDSLYCNIVHALRLRFDCAQRDTYINIRGEAQYPLLRAMAGREHSAAA